MAGVDAIQCKTPGQHRAFYDMEYTYKNEKGQTEKVLPERWQWGVVYEDGSETKQFDDEGSFHRFAEVVGPGRDNSIKMLVMHRDDGSKRYDVAVDRSMKLFHFYRNIILRAAQEDEGRYKIYVYGWENRTTGEKTFHYIMPDDRIVTANRDIDVNEFGVEKL